MGDQQTTSACPHPEAVGTRWGDPISEGRQAELAGYLDRWAAQTDHGERKGLFDLTPNYEVVTLTGAEVFWLAEQSGREQYGAVPHLHLEGADLSGEHLEEATLIEAHLERSNLFLTHMEHAKLSRAHLEEARLAGARLEGAVLAGAHLERSDSRGIHLERAHLSGAHLQGAVLNHANLEEADLSGAHMEGAELVLAHLNDANLSGAHLERADLRAATCDSKTNLNDATFDARTRLGDIFWGGVGSVNLMQIDWTHVPTLGDDQDMAWNAERNDQERVVRAYRQVATQLRTQGLTEVADRFADRGTVLQRRLYLRRFRIPQYLGSLFLDLVSGYGYRPVRSLVAYIVVILGFAATYFALGGGNGQSLSWNEAIVISMTAFHGRGFFSAVFQPGDLQAAIAAVEAFIGLLIEIVLIATFTQRFFAR